MKNKSKILCLVLWLISFFGVFHIRHLQKVEAEKAENDNQELHQYEGGVNSSYERADNSKKNIINILILIIKNS